MCVFVLFVCVKWICEAWVRVCGFLVCFEFVFLVVCVVCVYVCMCEWLCFGFVFVCF